MMGCNCFINNTMIRYLISVVLLFLSSCLIVPIIFVESWIITTTTTTSTTINPLLLSFATNKIQRHDDYDSNDLIQRATTIHTTPTTTFISMNNNNKHENNNNKMMTSSSLYSSNTPILDDTLSISSLSSTSTLYNDMNCPMISPATGLSNEFYIWKYNQIIRYQCSHTIEQQRSNRNLKPIIAIHGLFVNCDHYRHLLKEYTNNNEYIVYAIDLYGCGYSKPNGEYNDNIFNDNINGETKRFYNTNSNNDDDDYNGRIFHEPNPVITKTIYNATLGTADGRTRQSDIDLCHPVHSPYNFYTWCDVIIDFINDVIYDNNNYNTNDNSANNDNNNKNKETTTTSIVECNRPKVTIVCNSIGTMSTLQAVIERYDIFDGVFIICPNFRELHIAEIPYATYTMPIVRSIQSLLRNTTFGSNLFNVLAKPNIVGNILAEPYNQMDMIDDTLIDVLLSPLLLPHAQQVIFDTLSYSAGPLPEQQIQYIHENINNMNMNDDINDNINNNDNKVRIPILVCYGINDPWTPSARVEALYDRYYPTIQRVISIDNCGHCPHDERPDIILPLLNEFINDIYTIKE